jgi:hypothetical protein
MALASTLLRATVGGVCAGVGAGVGTVGIGSLTVLLRSGGGDGSRVAAASDSLSSSRDRLALRAANESISSCGGGSRLCAGHGCMQRRGHTLQPHPSLTLSSRQLFACILPEIHGGHFACHRSVRSAIAVKYKNPVKLLR